MAGGRRQQGAAGKRGSTRASRAERDEAVEAGAVAPAPQVRNGRSRAAAAAAGRGQARGAEEPVAGGHAMIDLEFLRGLIGAVDASGIDSIEISRAGTRIRISKTPPAAPAMPMPTMMAPPPVALPAMPAPGHALEAHAGGAHAAPAPAAGGAPAGAEAPPQSDLLEIRSPMVGTFYRAPAPEAPSYVEVGSQVSKGQTLCILEAMKLMNELESEVEGTVREILVENAEPVEFGQVLFRIEPRH